MPTVTETRRVTLETGAVTVVERWGDAGPTILCVHGIGSSRRDFARLGEALAGTHRVVAYDQRGHGDSATAVPLDLQTLANDLRAVADSVGTVTTVVGHSWGGAVALYGGPRVARSLVLVDPLIRVQKNTFGHDYVDDLIDVLAFMPGEERDAAIRVMFADASQSDREAKVHAMGQLALATVARIGSDNGVDVGGWDLRERLAVLDVPATILLAGEDSIVSADDIANLAPGVHVETIAGHGHTLHRSAFELFADAVRGAAA
jgi:pimeloyl-ACP methyl ester carboxylesterase